MPTPVDRFTRDEDPFRAFNAVDNVAATAGTDILQQTPGLVEQLRALGSRESGFETQGQVRDARERAGQASDVDFGTFQRKTAGLDLSDRQSAAARKTAGLGRVIAQADAAGQVRRQAIDDQKNIRAAAGGFSDILFGQRAAQSVDAASSEAADTAAAADRKANKKSATAETVGTVIGAALAIFSSEDLKDDRGHEHNLLDKLKNVRVNRWNYRGDNAQHIGPFSEEFNKEFEIKTDRPDMINIIDALGVTLGAVKELDAKVNARG